MAIYRNVSLTFWEDNKVVDDFTPEDRYFLLYLLTNPHTNLIGCYEISTKQMSNELGYPQSKVEELLTRMEQVHKIIFYAGETKEILIRNWHKYNWTKSEKLLKKIETLIQYIKSSELKKHIGETYKKYRVSIGYPYRMDTSDSVSVSVTDHITNTDINNKLNNNNIFSIIEENFGRMLAPLEIEEIKTWQDMSISEELITYATKIAVCNNAYSIKYISSILSSWQKKKITTIAQAQEDEKEFKNKKENRKNEPIWFNKDIKSETATKEEQEAIEKLLEEYRLEK